MDLYELTMANGVFTSDMRDTVTYFDMFFRRVPDKGGYAIMAGLEQLIEYMNNLKFGDEDIEYLKSLNLFREDFIEYLRNFKFCCDVWAVPEGTPIFPNEPIVTIRAPAIQAQLIETFILLSINHQSLIATRMTTEEMLPIVDKMDKVGYRAVECWGGATFDDVALFAKYVGPDVRIKAAGGIRTFEQAQAMLDACRSRGVDAAFQCCEHLNRAIVMEQRVLDAVGKLGQDAVGQIGRCLGDEEDTDTLGTDQLDYLFNLGLKCFADILKEQMCFIEEEYHLRFWSVSCFR